VPTYTTGDGRQRRDLRLIVRRTRLTDPAHAQLWPDWRYHAFITNLGLGTSFPIDMSIRWLATGDASLNAASLAKRGDRYLLCPNSGPN
jgi:hypothetical protein